MFLDKIACNKISDHGSNGVFGVEILEGTPGREVDKDEDEFTPPTEATTDDDEVNEDELWADADPAGGSAGGGGAVAAEAAAAAVCCCTAATAACACA